MATFSLPKGLRTKVDVASLVFFRVAFGVLLMGDTIRYIVQGKVERYIGTSVLFSYYGFDWVTPWSPEGMYIHYWLMALFAGLIALGLFYRAATILFFLAFTYVFLLDQAQYLNHFYLIALVSFIMTLIPAHSAFSLDSLIWKKRAADEAPAWALWLLRAEIGIVYVYAAIAKMNVDWMLRGEPLREWMSYSSGLPVIGPFMTNELLVWLFVYGGLFLDLLIVPALLWKRTRMPAFVFITIFHLLNSQIFDIGVFPWFMIATTTLFLEPDWIRKLLIRLFGPSQRKWRPLKQTGAALLPIVAIFLVWQLVFPLRHWLYPGDVNWTEEGHRFSWRMKLRQKNSIELQFTVTDPNTESGTVVDPLDYLSSRQFDSMNTRPDMILQFAHFLADQYEAGTGTRPRVTVRALTSLNGRPPQDLIDPTVDLAVEPRTLGHVEWIVPLER